MDILTPSLKDSIADLTKRKQRCGIILLTYLTKPRKFCSQGLCVLIVRGRDSGIWSLPKGSRDENETQEECACREMMEETGIHVELESNNPYADIGGNIYYFVNIMGNRLSDEQLLEFENQERLSTDEVDCVKWVSFGDLKYFDLNRDLKILSTMRNLPTLKRYTVKPSSKVNSLDMKDLAKRLNDIN